MNEEMPSDSTTQSPTNPVTPVASKDLDAALAYIFVLFIYTMIKRGNSASHVWHAKNGAGLLCLNLALMLGLNLLTLLSPNGLEGLLALLSPLLYLFIFGLSIYAAWQAWNGKQWTIPFVTSFAQKIPLEKWFHKAETLSQTPVSEAAPVAPAPVVEPAPTPVEPSPVAPAPVGPAPTPVEPTPTVPTPEPTPQPNPSNPSTPSV